MAIKPSDLSNTKPASQLYTQRQKYRQLWDQTGGGISPAAVARNFPELSSSSSLSSSSLSSSSSSG